MVLAHVQRICSTLRIANKGWGIFIMLRGFLAGAVSWLLIAPCAYAADRSQFEVLRINGELVRWFPKADGKTIITYAFADRNVVAVGAINCGSMRAPDRIIASAGINGEKLRVIAHRAFATWSQVANVSFEEATSMTEADVVIGEQIEPRGWAFTNIVPGPLRSGGFRQIHKGAICLNPERPWKNGFDGNRNVYDLSFTLTHEIGHILGLDHPSRRGQLMSFRYDETVAGLTIGDIAGASFMYGERRDRAIPASAAR